MARISRGTCFLPDRVPHRSSLVFVPMEPQKGVSISTIVPRPLCSPWPWDGSGVWNGSPPAERTGAPNTGRILPVHLQVANLSLFRNIRPVIFTDIRPL